MKIRNGFVSNSSSSSFIIAGNDRRNLTGEITIKVDLDNYIENEIKTVDELIIYFTEYLGYSLEELIKSDEYKKAKKALERGKTIFFGSFSNQSGDAIEEALCEIGLKHFDGHSIEIIDSEGGF